MISKYVSIIYKLTSIFPNSRSGWRVTHNLKVIGNLTHPGAYCLLLHDQCNIHREFLLNQPIWSITAYIAVTTSVLSGFYTDEEISEAKLIIVKFAEVVPKIDELKSLKNRTGVRKRKREWEDLVMVYGVVPLDRKPTTSKTHQIKKLQKERKKIPSDRKKLTRLKPKSH